MVTPPYQRSAGESGSALIEAMVSCAILMIALVALYLALDTQTAATATAKAGSVAAGLAEADQERLRSFRVPQLSNRHETRTETVGGQAYAVDSRAEWVRDATGGTQSCANASTQADYLRITSTVDGGPGNAKPVVLRSLVAPPVGQFGVKQGTIAIQASGAEGQPLQGASVGVTGPAALSDVTNELGCAVFGYVPIGSYAVAISAPGFVDPSGQTTAKGSATATEGTVNLTSLQYDRAGSLDVHVETKLGPLPQPALTSAISVAQAGVPGAGFRLFTGAQPQERITATSLFPFPTPYTVYSGSCPAANPAEYDEDYFATHPGSVALEPGGFGELTVREPALKLTLRSALSALVHIRIKAIDAGCTDVFDWRLTADATGTLSLPEPGLPFGRYSVCADVLNRRKTIGTVALTSPEGSAALTLDLRSGTTSGVCT